MDLNSVTAFVPLRERADLARWNADCAWLAGGTWLFSEPQPNVHTLLDLSTLGWTPISLTDRGVEIAATCTFAQLAAFTFPSHLTSLALVEPCCSALLGSFKVWNVATVGGNICLALPAGPMTALAASLDASAVIWSTDGGERRMPVQDFVTGVTATALNKGEVLRAIEVPTQALRRRTVLRRASLCAGGRSAALLIGTRDAAGFSLTITASTRRPVKFAFGSSPSSAEVRSAIDLRLPLPEFYDDVHGRPAWRQHLTRSLAEEIRAELTER